MKISRHKYYFIYKTTNLVNGKIYVGQRRTNNLDDGYIGCGICRPSDVEGNLPFHNAVRKHGYENFKREIIEFCKTLKQLDKREIFWIAKLNGCNREIGYNIHTGGHGGDNITNHPNYKEICRKIGEKSKGRPGWNKGLTKETDERVRRISERLTGRVLSEEHRQHCSEGLKGTIRTQEFKDHLSKINIGRIVSKESIENWQTSYQKRLLETCPHCNYQSRNAGCMKRYHFDNCKQLQEQKLVS